MEKLIELLNEYEKLDVWSYDEEMWMPYFWYGYECDYETFLISKRYLFIQRLVENDKVDYMKIRDRWGDMQFHFTDEELLLMTLAIQDNPIEFLISILK